jgi:hypothetical protein
MQFQIWFAGLNMGVDMKTRAQRIKKRGAKAAKAASTPARKSKLQQVA